MNNNPYLLHDLLCLPHIAFSHLGNITRSDLSKLSRIDIPDDTWQEVKGLKPADPSIITYSWKQIAMFDELIVKYFPILNDYKRKQIHVKSGSVPLHDDTANAHVVRGQLMFITKNSLNHILYVIDDREQYFVPEPGDIIFLDIYCKHAVHPNARYNDSMESTPFKFSGMSLPLKSPIASHT